jgi:hypothetical protein
MLREKQASDSGGGGGRKEVEDGELRSDWQVSHHLVLQLQRAMQEPFKAGVFLHDMRNPHLNVEPKACPPSSRSTQRSEFNLCMAISCTKLTCTDIKLMCGPMCSLGGLVRTKSFVVPYVITRQSGEVGFRWHCRVQWVNYTSLLNYFSHWGERCYPMIWRETENVLDKELLINKSTQNLE